MVQLLMIYINIIEIMPRNEKFLGYILCHVDCIKCSVTLKESAALRQAISLA